MSSRTSGNGSPMTLSQVPGCPSFRASAVNAVAVIPLLSSDRNGHDDPSTFSSQSFQHLLQALNRYNQQNTGVTQPGEDLLLVVPNSSLTRPGDWKYDKTPLKNFHWGHGCQRVTFFDGRPYNSRMAHDRLINHELTRNWIDLCPHRRTAALIGVLNVRDCPDKATLRQAEQEWQQWAERYSAPPYEVSAHGRDFERDLVVQRLFVYDSFHESNKVDINQTSLGASLVAFPPTDEGNVHMMDLHMNVVVNDLAVAIFQELEGKITESDAITKGADGQPLSSNAAKSRFFQLSGKSQEDEDEAPQGSANLSINNLASVVGPDSKLAARDANKRKEPTHSKRASVQAKLSHVVAKGSSSEAQLLTPMDHVWDYSELNPKDAQEMMRREVGRREKFAADLSLLAGSPLDAYERYMKAAELCKTTCPDPLWYASALEGCAAAHIAMAEAGGFNVDSYLETSFQLPDSMMACAVVPSGEKSTKQTMTRVVTALCEDALNVLSRHQSLACFRAELLLKLAWYASEVEDAQIRCQWGLGEGCYGGDAGSDKRRWEMASATQFNFLELKTKQGEDVIALHTLERAKRFSECMHQAVAAGALDSVTRADVALRCASMSLKGLRPTNKPTTRERLEDRLQLKRKATFFAVAAAEAMSDIEGDIPDERASALWLHASKMLSQRGNGVDSGTYGWATLRAVALHGLAMQGLSETSEEAAVQLLSLMGEISPAKQNDDGGLFSKLDEIEETAASNALEDSMRSDNLIDTFAAESVVSAAREYVRETRAKVAAQSKTPAFFTTQTKDSSLLTVAQSKWVEDDPLPTILLPMAELSNISDSILAMRSVWSAIKFESCFRAQKNVVNQISHLRSKMPASSVQAKSAELKATLLPIKITSVVMVDSEPHEKFERVKVNREQVDTGAMATFYNPFENKKGQTEATVVPVAEERYILVKFANNLSIPLEIPRCQLEFNISPSDRIKAPAISFVIPGQTEDFAVQFPFIILKAAGPEEERESNSFEIKGLHVTCLARSFFLPLRGRAEKTAEQPSLEPNIPDPASLYSRRSYKSQREIDGEGIEIPKLEVVPSQPNLLISFASSSSPIEEGTVIPAPIADGEVFALPKLCLANDAGIGEFGKLEDLRITATGLPGLSSMVLFDLCGSATTTNNRDRSKSGGAGAPLILSASCENMDKDTLNDKDKRYASALSLELSSTVDMGARTKGCTVTLTFEYRGAAPSSSMQVWRKRKIDVRILRIKGPRVSSITFRPDLTWESAYSELCQALSHQDPHKRYRPSKIQAEVELLQRGSTDEDTFVASRLGKDPGVHVCGDEVVVVVSVANETSCSIQLSSPNGPVGGFEGNTMETFSVKPGVSAKIPMIIPRVERGPDVCSRLTSKTQLTWKSESTDEDAGGTTESGGTMIPVNRRLRSGKLEIPKSCLKAIIDENPTFLSRICKSPCAIDVQIVGGDGEKSVETSIGKPSDVSVDIQLADWVPEEVLEQCTAVLEFCCARKGVPGSASKGSDYVWCGQIRKSLRSSDAKTKQSHRARIMFLSAGDFAVSACVSFHRTDVEDDVKETWWAQHARSVRVQDAVLKQ